MNNRLKPTTTHGQVLSPEECPEAKPIYGGKNDRTRDGNTKLDKFDKFWTLECKTFRLLKKLDGATFGVKIGKISEMLDAPKNHLIKIAKESDRLKYVDLNRESRIMLKLDGGNE